MYMNAEALRASYGTLYNSRPAFDLGVEHYQAFALRPAMSGFDEQAYDRGMEFAMKLARAEDWERENVGAN